MTQDIQHQIGAWSERENFYLFIGGHQPYAPRRIRSALNAEVQVSQTVQEVLIVENPYFVIPQFIREVLLSDYGPQIFQFVREILVEDAPTMPIPTPYPTLPGLGFSVIKRIIGGNTPVAKAVGGRELRIQYWTYPAWEWDLTYEYLPDYAGAGATSSDIKALAGFLLANFGSFSAFPFLDPDDNGAVNQQIGTGNGSTTSFVILKTYGLGSEVGAEPIGWLNTGETFNVYKNGVLQTLTTDYIVNLSLPYSQRVIFVVAPSIGDVISVDMQYYFMTRIFSDTNEFEKFMNLLWANKKVTLVSLKGT